MSPLRLVTLNTAKCDEPYWQRLALMAEGLGALAPDVVALQECFACQLHADTAAMLAHVLSMHSSWAPARRKVRAWQGGEHESDSGLAVLTRRRPLASAVVELPSDPRDGQRVSQLVLLQHEGQKLLVGNVHLTHLRGADDLRRAQLGALVDHPWFQRDDLTARIVCGDFNTPHDQLPELTAGLGGWHVVDAFLAGGGGPRTTLARARAEGRERCVDFVLSFAESDEAHPRFAESSIALDQADAGGVLPSDHFAVTACVGPRPG